MNCDKNPYKIKNMFDEISEYYDFMNNCISLGTHYFIKYLSLKLLDIKQYTLILDLCCGTGDFSKIISKLSPTSKVIGLDFSAKMLKTAKQKNPQMTFIQGDCTYLPFKDNEFDYITIGFGLRNIANRTKAISEIYRILKPQGKFLHLDFGTHNTLSRMFDLIVLSAVKLTGKNFKHYKYLLESKKDFPPPDKLIKEFEKQRFKFIKRQDYLFGIISAQIMEK